MINNLSRHKTVLAATISLMLAASISVQAQSLALADLPEGCTYSEKSQQPLNGSIKISATDAIWSEVGDAPRTLMQIGVQCRGPVSQAVSVLTKESSNLNWIGPARDVLATNVPGIGVRLFAETDVQGGQCSGAGVLSISNRAHCSLPAEGADQRRLNFAIKAQLIKTSHNTPIQSQTALRSENGGVLLLNTDSLTQASVDVMNSGLISPTIATQASCTLITQQNHTVDFGQVYRPKNSKSEMTIGQPQATRIEVACSPLRDDAANNYGVDITFTAGQQYQNDATALATSIDDMAIRFATKPDATSWLKFGEKLPVAYNASISGGKSHFDQTYYWFLRYMPAGNHNQTGKLNALATYTITIQ